LKQKENTNKDEENQKIYMRKDRKKKSLSKFTKVHF